MTPLLVQENYLSVTPHNLPSNLPLGRRDFSHLIATAQAADFIAIADVVSARVSSQQQWSLAPLHGALSCLAPGACVQGNISRLQFPVWLGRNSTNTKRWRLLGECATHMQVGSGALHASAQASPTEPQA